MVEVCAIASGSNGNCYYVGNDEEAVIIDAGISFRQLKKRMEEKNLSLSKIKSLIISHEHSDHSRGIYSVTKQLSIPVFVTPKTNNVLIKRKIEITPSFFKAGEVFNVNSLRIKSLVKKHDAADPSSFIVGISGMKIGVFTDIGKLDDNLTKEIADCDFIFIETNYDERMLEEGNYPYYLKKRVKSDVGHLSNKQAFNLINNIVSMNLKGVMLSHISAENNTPEKAFSEFSELRDKKIKVLMSNRNGASDVFSLI